MYTSSSSKSSFIGLLLLPPSLLQILLLVLLLLLLLLLPLGNTHCCSILLSTMGMRNNVQRASHHSDLERR